MKKSLLGLLLCSLLVLPLSAARVKTTAAAASLVVATGPSRLVQVFVYNAGAAQFIQIHNAASLPANGAVPEYSFTVPAGANATYTFTDDGEPFSAGVVVCNSSTQATKTIGAADCWFTGRTK